jgi:hypothetical protein
MESSLLDSIIATSLIGALVNRQRRCNLIKVYLEPNSCFLVVHKPNLLSRDDIKVQFKVAFQKASKMR